MAAAVLGQSVASRKAALQKEYNSIVNEIKSLQKIIEQRKKERSISIHEVELINNKIEKRKKLISNIEIQMKGINHELIEKQSEVQNLSIEINKLREEYKKLVIWLNKNHESADRLAFVIEANSFKDAYQRIRYIKKYGDYRAKQSHVMKNQIDRIMDRILALNQVKAEKTNLLKVNKYQQEELIDEKKNRDVMVSKLSDELQSLKSKVDEKNKQASIVNARIRKVIEEEIKKQRESLMTELRNKRKRQAMKNNTAIKDEDIKFTTEDFQNSPEGILSSSFKASRGNMPWPVSSGNITSRFGRQPHPADPSIFVENNGIDIKSPDNAEVKSIYKGTVVRIFEMPTYQTCLMMKHGEYFTVYSYLKSTNVKVGESIEPRQCIGKCGYSDQHGHSLVNLQIWHYQNKQNPENWIRGR
jgi:septal ring factor EnvC (AmiA/AmiB activator)